MKTAELRKKYLEFFEGKNHVIFRSDTLVPDDPTVLFTSAGMNQFKPYFLGEKKEVKRAASCQKCLRTCDLEEVGKTPYHHTFFEMLGNFSFGDYFKKEAIEFAYEFLLKCLNMKEEDIWVSVYKDDPEAYHIWEKYIGIPEVKIVKLGEDKNFWPANAPALGPNGPCGPCSEIFFDKGKGKGCGKVDCSPACSCSRFVEIWNLVFTQFNRTGENQLLALPQKNIDTGMGLERMAGVLQGKESNFQIDIFLPVVKLVREILGIDDNLPKTISLINAIVDHGRAASFAIADGVYPSNEERGYVVRKIIRKAVWSAHLLCKRKPFLYELTYLYAELMQQDYKEINEKKEIIAKVIKVEEEKFLSTLEEGKSQFVIFAQNLKDKSVNKISAEELFRLYDTYGFPWELSRELAKEYSLEIDGTIKQDFEKLLQGQRERSRGKSMFEDTIFKEGQLKFEEHSEFVGYSSLSTRSNIVRILKDNKEVSVICEGEKALVVLDTTPFYPEGGGQLTDRGNIITSGGEFQVDEVFKIGETIVHKGIVKRGEVRIGSADSGVEEERRRGLMRAHTATHLLQAGLREVLGTHVAQQGSLVDEDRLRFDFTHFQGLCGEELKKVEEFVNQCILKAHPVHKEILSYDEAKRQGALAFFKDKYKQEVRLISISHYSKELCAGTHLDKTSEIGGFIIVSESSISSGVRRIEAIVGKQAWQFLSEMRDSIEELNSILKTQDLKTAVIKLSDDLKKEREKTEALDKKIISQETEDIIKVVKEIKGVNLVVHSFSGRNYPSLLYFSDVLRKKWEFSFIFLVSWYEDKNIFVCSVGSELIKKGISCSKFLSLFGKELSLKGGGRDNLVQGVILMKQEDFLDKVKESISQFLESM